MSILTHTEKGKKVVVMGDEAIARGAIEAGVGFFSCYPGTPATGIADSLAQVQGRIPGLHFEYSINEIVATDVAVGAAWSGVRSMVAFKHVGMNVAADNLFSLAYIGAKGMVIVNGADPGALSSANEQDNRWYCLSAHLPMLEPSDIQEAKDFTRKAFELSERFDLPIILNASHAICHSVGVLELGEFPDVFPTRVRLSKPIPVKDAIRQGRLALHKALLEKEAQIREYAAQSELNRVLEGNASWGIVTSGSSYGYTLEALHMLGIYDVPILKLGMVHPVSPEQVRRFLHGRDKVVIIEELDGFIESQVKLIAFESGLRTPIVGKEWFSAVGNLSPSLVAMTLSQKLGAPLPSQMVEGYRRFHTTVGAAPTRTPMWCCGCPHRGSAYAIKKATGGEALLGGDIGCYAMMGLPPSNLNQWRVHMGSGIGIVQGASHKVEGVEKLAVIGDSTFFHAGIPPLLNALWNKADVLLMILDNHWLAMTGHQPTPTTAMTLDGERLKTVDITGFLRSLGVQYVRKVDPFRPLEMADAIKEALEQPGVKVLLAEGECGLQSQRREERQPSPAKAFYAIEPERCQKCDECFAVFACPAIQSVTSEEGLTSYYIDEVRCTKCGACRAICPNSAITVSEVNPHLAGARA